MSFEVTTDKDIQPSKGIPITVTYSDADVQGFTVPKLAIARYDPDAASWVVLDSRVDTAARTITAVTPHLSKFAVVEPVAVSHLANVRVFPNPYKPGSGTSFDRAGGMMFSNLTADAKIQVYAVTGELVFEGEETDGDGRYEWPAVNSSGEKVASGVYVFRITNAAGEKKTGKLAVIR
jgi:hypothetical protein